MTITAHDITRLLLLRYIHRGEYFDLPIDALESLRKFPGLVTITVPNDDPTNPWPPRRSSYRCVLTSAGYEFCARVASNALAEYISREEKEE